MEQNVKDRIDRYRRAYPVEAEGKRDIEILYYLNFHRDLKKETDRVLENLKKAIAKAEGGTNR